MMPDFLTKSNWRWFEAHLTIVFNHYRRRTRIENWLMPVRKHRSKIGWFV